MRAIALVSLVGRSSREVVRLTYPLFTSLASLAGQCYAALATYSIGLPSNGPLVSVSETDLKGIKGYIQDHQDTLGNGLQW